MSDRKINWYFPLLATIATTLIPGWQPAQAQLIPDHTLDPEGSVVVPIEALIDEIRGGAARECKPAPAVNYRGRFR
ncbi:MAG: hypothetical protein F6J92_36645 [Symploca sp. SIO1A3]|nr:hypothetical protein [Symploca sp. SIO1A3]